MTTDKIYDSYQDYQQVERVKAMTVADMLAEFHTIFKSPRNQNFYDVRNRLLEELASKLIKEEHGEFESADEADEILGELADLVYVAYGYADRWGWDLDEAVRRKHLANMSKLDENGKPIFREDGKVLKSSLFKPADLSDLV